MWFKDIRFAKSARKHKIGRAHALFVMKSYEPRRYYKAGFPDERLEWLGVDDRGLELEIVGIKQAAVVLVIHVMPANYRRGK